MIGIEERNAVLRVLDSGILSGYRGAWGDDFYGGPEIKALEKEWVEYFGVKHAIACNSATSGLWMACAAIGLQQDYQTIQRKNYYKPNPHIFIPEEVCFTEYHPDEVIVTPYSMTCSASIPLHFGAKPVFADIEEDYYCLDVKSIEERITERTKAIIVVDLFGMPYNADAINELAERKGKEYGHKIYVIEDTAQAIGAKYKGKYAGTLGDIGVFSLNFHKHIHCGEGGIVVTNDDELAMKLRLVANHSEAVINDIYRQSNETQQWLMTDVYTQLVGLNLRMTEIQAAIAREQLKKLNGILKKIRYYAANSFNIDVRPDCDPAYYRYAWMSYNESEFEYYKKRSEFEVKKHYIKPIYQMPLFQSLGYDQHSCPVCEKVDENIVLAWLKDMP